VSNKINPCVVLSGCSGGGKSTLLAELATRGYGTVEEPGRRIIAQEELCDGEAVPWRNPSAFLQRALAMAEQDLAAADASQGWRFFDRGVIDAASGLAQLANVPIAQLLETKMHYHQRVFLTPPWSEIYFSDAQRQHSLSQAIEEYERLLVDFPALGYEVVLVPKANVTARADFVLAQLSL